MPRVRKEGSGSCFFWLPSWNVNLVLTFWERSKETVSQPAHAKACCEILEKRHSNKLMSGAAERALAPKKMKSWMEKTLEKVVVKRRMTMIKRKMKKGWCSKMALTFTFVVPCLDEWFVGCVCLYLKPSLFFTLLYPSPAFQSCSWRGSFPCAALTSPRHRFW